MQIRITPDGLTGTIGATLSVPTPSSEVEGEPSGVVTAVPAPELPVAGNKDIYFAVTDDLFNLLFAAMTFQGNLQTDCAPSDQGLVVGDLLPTDCTALATAAERGRCQGAKGVACDSLPLGERFTPR